MSGYVKIRSWHVATFTDRGGALRTRCGRRARVEGTITSGPGGPTEVSLTSETLPGDERTCERCFVLVAKDRDRAATLPQPVEDPVLPEPLEDPVPE